jgi:hypothetical protein
MIADAVTEQRRAQNRVPLLAADVATGFLGRICGNESKNQRVNFGLVAAFLRGLPRRLTFAGLRQ